MFETQNLPNQMAGLSLNNDYAAAKAAPPPLQAQPIPNQQAFGNMQPQTAYPNKPMMPVAQPQNIALNNRPPMPPNNNPMFAPSPANGTQPSQVPPSFNGSANQFPPQVRQYD